MNPIEHYIRASHTRQTTDNYIYTIKQFLSIHPKAAMYSFDDIIQYMESLIIKGLKDQSRVRILSAIKKYYDYLIDIGERQDHPCKTLVVKNNRRQIQVLDLFNRKELEILFLRPNRYRLLNIRNKVLLSLLIYQGLSSAEIVSLNLSNIDLDQGAIYIKASKRYKSRLMEMHINQADLFSDYIYKIRPELLKVTTNRFILGKTGSPISVDGIHSMIEPLKALFPDRKLSPKTVRQSVISYWLNERKLPLEDVQVLAGHRYPSATQKYKRIDAEEKRKWVNKFHPLK